MANFDSVKRKACDDKTNQIIGGLRIIENEPIIEISSWSGRPYGSGSGIIVTKHNELYKYSFYKDPNLSNDEKYYNEYNYLTFVKELNKIEYFKLITFIKTVILSRTIQEDMTYDCGRNLDLNYKDNHIHIALGFDNKIYNTIYNFLDKL